jgi:hypothetical protein
VAGRSTHFSPPRTPAENLDFLLALWGRLVYVRSYTNEIGAPLVLDSSGFLARTDRVLFAQDGMNADLGRNLARLGAGISVVLLAGAVSAPMARAECGSYVMMGTRPTNEAQAVPATSDPSVQHHQPAAPGKPVLPCSGPHCSGGSVPLAPPPTVPAPVRNESGECAASVVVSRTSSSDTLPLEHDALHSVDRELPVYHPPR